MEGGHGDQAPGAVPWRYLPAASLSLLFAIVAALYLSGNTGAYEGILRFLGLDPFRFPFLDIFGVLSMTECHTYGIDVIAENPCDVLGRHLDYSPFLLITARLGLHATLTPYAGLALCLLFLGSTLFLPPVRGRWETATLTLALLSSVVTYALERANLDLAIFAAGVIAANWALRSLIWRLGGYELIMLAALTKFYPAMMLILALRERLRILSLVAVAALGVAAFLAASWGGDTLRVLAQIETGSWFNTAFGAQNLPRGMAELMSPLIGDSPHAATLIEMAMGVVIGTLAVALAIVENLQESLDFLSERNRIFLLVGCALIVGCFFAAQNGAYRGIYFLFVLPPVTALWQAPVSSAARKRFIGLGAAIVFLMWALFFDHAREEILGLLQASENTMELSRFAFWLLREVVWWWVATILLALGICLIYSSHAGQRIRYIILRARNGFGRARA